MQERHTRRDKYFEEQAFTTERHVIPFINEVKHINHGTEVLEIGCGEGGNLKPFVDMGCQVTGVDILEGKINNARKFFSGHPNENKLKLVVSDIYLPHHDLGGKFDVIFMRDVLEHIHDQEKFMGFVKKFLKPDGVFFLGFPPWQNPFGGHQQMCYSRFLSKLPWFHLLPGKLYPWVLKMFREPEVRVDALLEIRDTRINIERFRRIIRKEHYRVIKEVFWLINPNYEIKFNMKPRKMNRVISSIPYLRDFLITTNYYVLGL